MKIIYHDRYLWCVEKDAGVPAEDVPGGVPAWLRAETGKEYVGVVHRLDTGTGGVMLYAATREATAALSEAVRTGALHKEYLAVVHGCPADSTGSFRDLLYHDPRSNKTFVVARERKGVKEAALDYRVLASGDNLSLLCITLLTGRSHQIRVQFASRQMPLAGDRKYGARDSLAGIALWAQKLTLQHPLTGETLTFSSAPPVAAPWNGFAAR